MEKARSLLHTAASGEISSEVSRLDVPHPGKGHSVYEAFSCAGISVDDIQPGFLTCSFRVPSRLTNREGNLSEGAIANLVDELGAAALVSEGIQAKVTVDMSISYMSKAKLNDDLEITARVLGHKGGYSGTHVLLKNKETGEFIADGRHSLFGKLKSHL